MAKSADEYAGQLAALLPPGAVWNLDADSKLSAFWFALAQELARVDLRADALVNESDPRTISETLPEWEALLGLPDPCVSFDQTTAERVRSVVAKYIAQGGQSPAYFIEIAAALGFTITLTEFRPYTVGMAVNLPICGSTWAYAWQVNAPLASVQKMTVADAVDNPLRWWENEILECVMKRLKPAHTSVLFAYA